MTKGIQYNFNSVMNAFFFNKTLMHFNVSLLKQQEIQNLGS